MYYNVTVKDETTYFDIKADSPEEAEQIALDYFDERYHAIEIEESNVFGNTVDGICFTDEIHKIITSCPQLLKENTCRECVKFCPLAKVCYTYWTGDDNT